MKTGGVLKKITPHCMSSAQMGQNGPLSKRHLGPLLVWLD